MRIATPCIEIPLLDEQRGVLLDHVSLVLDVVVGETDFVVGGSDELLAEPEVERRTVETASGIEICGIEGPQYVWDFVFDHVSSVGEVVAGEVGHDLEAVSGAEDVGIGESDHRAAFGVQGSVGGYGPAVAGRNPEIDAGGVDRVGFYGDVDIRDIVAGPEELFGPDDELGVEIVSGFEEEVAADDPFTCQHVCFVGRSFEPFASGIEHLFAVDGDFSDFFSGEGSELFRFIEDLSVRCGIEHGFHEDHPVQHSGYGPTAGFGFDAVVESVVSGSGVGVPDSCAVGREPVRGLHTGSHTGSCRRDRGWDRRGNRCYDSREDQDQQEHGYTELDDHVSKITQKSRKTYGKNACRAFLRIKKGPPCGEPFLWKNDFRIAGSILGEPFPGFRSFRPWLHSGFRLVPICRPPGRRLIPSSAPFRP